MFNRSDNRNKQTNKNTNNNGIKNIPTRTNAPKRVISSKALNQGSNGKSCSTGVIEHDKKSTAQRSVARPKKNTKSDLIIPKTSKPFDFCTKCGDTVSKSSQKSNSQSSASDKIPVLRESKSRSTISNGRSNSVDQYYKNENFRRSTESMRDENGVKKISLDTIKELPERRSSVISKSKTDITSIFTQNPSEEIGFLDIEDLDSIKKLKEFREKNYFECHSAKSRIDNKVSALSLKDHKCTYRFYLNDRLFPVPVSTDHQNKIRCVECHLPLDLKDSDEDKANGFIQAKIRIGEKDPQDTVLFLPVKDQLIIKERKREERKEDDVLYFGVIKLDPTGNSLLNQNLPTNSFALKYQKGYKEYQHNEDYRLQSMDKCDVVVV